MANYAIDLRSDGILPLHGDKGTESLSGIETNTSALNGVSCLLLRRTPKIPIRD